MHLAEFRLLMHRGAAGRRKTRGEKMKDSQAMLLKTNHGKMSVFRLLAMLVKTNELKSFSGDVNEKKWSWLKPEVENGGGASAKLRFCFAVPAASTIRWRARQAKLGVAPRLAGGPATIQMHGSAARNGETPVPS
jgi:hypothetical protein